MTIERSELVEKALPVFARRPEILVAYLFGSRQTGREHPLSDVDFAVLVAEDQLRELDLRAPYGFQAELVAELMSALRESQIDVVILNRAGPLLAHEVIRSATPIFCRDRELQIRFEVATKRKYLDTRSIRRIQGAYLKRGVEQGRFGRG